MTITHLSHFGLEMIGETDTNVLFSGSLAACKRMALAHGCQTDAGRGPILSSDRGKAIYAPGPIIAYELTDETGEHAGIIHRGRDNWALVLNRKVWESK